METFLRALVEHYSSDRIAAGLQIAYLPDKGGFYCAVHRFPTNVASRMIVVKATGDTLNEAITQCSAVWTRLITDQKATDAGVV